MNVLLDFLMHKITYRRELPYWVRQVFYYSILTFSGRLRLSLQRKSGNIVALIKTGIVEMGNVRDIGLDPARLKEAVRSCRYVARYDSENKLVKKIYDHQSLVRIPQVLSFATNITTLRLCTQFFHGRPSVAYIAAWETFGNDAEDTSEMFYHMDHHGHRFLKKFCYLTDVGIGDGEHQFIKGTTERSGFYKRLRQNISSSPELYQDLISKRRLKGDFRLCNDRITSFFDEKIMRVTGVAGTVFLEDTYGLHRGTPVSCGKSRLILQVVYVPWVLQKDASRSIEIQVDAVTPAHVLHDAMKESYRVTD